MKHIFLCKISAFFWEKYCLLWLTGIFLYLIGFDHFIDQSKSLLVPLNNHESFPVNEWWTSSNRMMKIKCKPEEEQYVYAIDVELRPSGNCALFSTLCDRYTQ